MKELSVASGHVTLLYDAPKTTDTHSAASAAMRRIDIEKKAKGLIEGTKLGC